MVIPLTQLSATHFFGFPSSSPRSLTDSPRPAKRLPRTQPSASRSSASNAGQFFLANGPQEPVNRNTTLATVLAGITIALGTIVLASTSDHVIRKNREYTNHKILNAHSFRNGPIYSIFSAFQLLFC